MNLLCAIQVELSGVHLELATNPNFSAYWPTKSHSMSPCVGHTTYKCTPILCGAVCQDVSLHDSDRLYHGECPYSQDAVTTFGFLKAWGFQFLVFALHPFLLLGTSCYVMLNCKSLHLTKMGKKPGCCSASGWDTSFTETEHTCKLIADKWAFGQRETWKNAVSSVDSYSGLASQVLNKAQTSNFIWKK